MSREFLDPKHCVTDAAGIFNGQTISVPKSQLPVGYPVDVLTSLRVVESESTLFDSNPMHDDPSIRNPAYLSLTDQQLSEIDALCDRFDQELVNGTGPRIETFLAEAPEAARDGLLAELLAMEVEYRTQQGDKPQPDDYIQRFPQQESVIASVFARDAATQSPGQGDDFDPGQRSSRTGQLSPD